MVAVFPTFNLDYWDSLASKNDSGSPVNLRFNLGWFEDFRYYEGLTLYNIYLQGVYGYIRRRHLRLSALIIAELHLTYGLNIPDLLDLQLSWEKLPVNHNWKTDIRIGATYYTKVGRSPVDKVQLSAGIYQNDRARIYGQVAYRFAPEYIPTSLNVAGLIGVENNWNKNKWDLTILADGEALFIYPFFPSEDTSITYVPINGQIVDDKLEVILTAYKVSINAQTQQTRRMMSHTLVATVSLSNLQLQSITPLASGEQFFWGISFSQDSIYTYIYGKKHTATFNGFYTPAIARFPKGSLLQPWEYFDGNLWQNEPVSISGSLSREIGDQISYFSSNGKKYYFQINQNSQGLQEISSYTSEGGYDLNILYPRRGMYCPSENVPYFDIHQVFFHPSSNAHTLYLGYYVSSRGLNFDREFKFIQIEDWIN